MGEPRGIQLIEESRDSIVANSCLVYGGINHEKTCGRILHYHSAGRLAASIRARKSAFPTGRFHGSSSGNPGPSYSANVSDIGS